MFSRPFFLKNPMCGALRCLCFVVVLIAIGATSASLIAQPRLTNGRIERVERFQSKYVDARTVDVWLPDGYSNRKKYAVVYMHDGQMLFDATTTWNKQEWRVDEVLGDLTAKGRVRDAIVVAIWNNGEYRHSEYFAAKALMGLTPEIRERIERENLKGRARADDYLRFIVEELKPYVDGKYPTIKDRANTFAIGSSMGGVISIYAMCEYPQVFGGAAALSTHWPLIGVNAANGSSAEVAEAFREYLKKTLPRGGSNRIYFDLGDQTLDSYYLPHQRAVDEIMRSLRFTNKNWVTRSFPGEDHSEISWAKRLDVPFLFLLGKKRS
jgi:predicted alpha/beta superfamily hydrolase